MKIPDSLKKSISSKVLKKAEAGDSKVSGIKELDTISNNFAFLPNIAKDLNVARQNIFKLVKLEGGKPTRASNVSADKTEKSPTLVSEDQPASPKKKEKGESSFEMGQRFASFFLDMLRPKNLLSLAKLISIGAIFIGAGIITLFKDAFIGLADYFIDAIKEAFSSLVEFVGKFFEDIVQPILNDLKTFFIEKIWPKIIDFFKPIFDWVGNKITSILEFLNPVFNFIGEVFGKIKAYVGNFTGLISSAKATYESIKKRISESAASADGGGRLDEFGNPILDPVDPAPAAPVPVPAPAPAAPAPAPAAPAPAPAPKPVPAPAAPAPAPAPKPVPKGAVTTEGGGVVSTGSDGVLTTAPAPSAPAPAAPTPAPAAAKPPAAPAAAPAAPSAPSPTPAAGAAAPAKDVPAQIISELKASGITSTKAQANILANVAKESNFRPINEELERYTAKTLFNLYGGPEVGKTKSGKPLNEKKNIIRFPTMESAIDLVKQGAVGIGDVIYGGRLGNDKPGDGYKYRGRGYIQLTGKEAYEKLGKFVGVDLVGDPDKVNHPSIAAKLVPAFFLKFKGKRPEDLEDINSVNTLVGSADPESVKKRVSLAGDFTSKLASGESIQATSTDVASGKRQQQKPKTPVIVNAPTTNTTTVVKNESVRNPKEKKADTGQTLFERAA